MKHTIDIVINVSKDKRHSISEMFEHISGDDEVKVMQEFMMAMTRIRREIYQRELQEVIEKEKSDDIPF